MKMLYTAIAAALLATTTAAIAVPAHAPNPFNDQLRALGELQRNAVIRRGILDSGKACKRVTGATFIGPYGNLMRWNAWCAPTGDYAIYIGTDSSVQVSPCADARKLKLPVCVARPK